MIQILKNGQIDFMFQLTEDEYQSLISQTVISKTEKRGGTRKLPYAFTEQGVAMLSSVLRSDRTIQVNISIIRVYTKMKQLLVDNKDLWIKMKKIEQALLRKDDVVQQIFKVLKKLIVQETKPTTEIGFPANRKNIKPRNGKTF